MDTVSAFGILMLFSATVVIGYIGSLIFEKTKIPDAVWLLLFGVLIGPFLGVVSRESFIAFSPLLSAIAIVIILFDAGLNMNFYQVVKEFPRSILLALLGIGFSMLCVGLLARAFFGFDLLEGILLGAIVGGISSPVVISITKGLQIKDSVKTLLNLESVFTDPLCIIVSIVIIETIISNISGTVIVHNIFSAFSIGAVIGIISGFVWLFVLDTLKQRQFDYMLTLAVLFMLYVFAETIGGSGAIVALFFGLVLGNAKIFSNMLKLGKELKLDYLMKRFQSELSFFVRSFFFVFLGVIVTINHGLITYSIVIAATLVIVRFLVVQISTTGMHINPLEMNTMRIMSPRGLAAAVLAQLPIVYGLPHAEIFPDVVFIVILTTIIYTTFAVKLSFKNEERERKRVEKNAGDEVSEKIDKILAAEERK
ncbi:MAG: cation:proton antiporter [Candidatus Aenigmarchaeota archaeon]|nr:cation:proton antiporter [Candidatus Aenigmarchaeota archaeon]